MKPTPDYLTCPQAARTLQVSRAKIRAWIEAGEIEAFDVAGPGATRSSLRISRHAVEAFLQKRIVVNRRPPVRRRLVIPQVVKEFV